MEIELVSVNWNQSFKFTSSTHKDNNKCSYTRGTAFLEQASISFLPCFLSLCRWSYLEIHHPPFLIFLFLAMLGLCCCLQAFSSCESRGCSLVAVQWLPLSWSTGSRHRASVVVACGLSCRVACGLFPDQGGHLGPLHWQADS